MAKSTKAIPAITFIDQTAPVEEYGRALYAVGRSVIRALLDSLSEEDLTDLNTPAVDVNMRQLAKFARLERDKGMRGDGFEWAVHEAILGKEPKVLEPIAQAMAKTSPRVSSGNEPTSLMFGQERARYLGFLDAMVAAAGDEAYLLPDGRGRPFNFGPWVSTAARGKAAEIDLPDRIKSVWKTDVFLSGAGNPRHFAATVKSNFSQLEGGKGLRIGIVPEAKAQNPAGVRWSPQHQLWVVSLADPDGFMGMFDDAYRAVARAICTLGKHKAGNYYDKPSAKAQRLQDQLEKHGDAKVLEIEAALDEAAQQKLVTTQQRLVSVNAPHWLHLKQMAPKLIAARPKFEKLD